MEIEGKNGLMHSLRQSQSQYLVEIHREANRALFDENRRKFKPCDEPGKLYFNQDRPAIEYVCNSQAGR